MNMIKNLTVFINHSESDLKCSFQTVYISVFHVTIHSRKQLSLNMQSLNLGRTIILQQQGVSILNLNLAKHEIIPLLRSQNKNELTLKWKHLQID